MIKIYKEISFFSQYDLKGEAESKNSAGKFLHHSRQKAAFPQTSIGPEVHLQPQL